MRTFDGLLLASGGMDSTVLAYDLEQKQENIVLLFLNYGQHCSDTEFDTLKSVVPKRFVDNVRTINISGIYLESKSRMIREADLWVDNVVADDLYLPYRNLLFLSIAAAYAQSLGIGKVYSAFINSNHAKEIDCSIEFFTRLEALLHDYGSVQICTPFREMSKTDVARLGVSLGAPIARTYSCQINAKVPCGSCPNCVDRIEALDNLLKEE